MAKLSAVDSFIMELQAEQEKEQAKQKEELNKKLFGHVQWGLAEQKQEKYVKLTPYKQWLYGECSRHIMDIVHQVSMEVAERRVKQRNAEIERLQRILNKKRGNQFRG